MGFFPADTDRQSGFLSPLVGQSRLRGFQYFQPYYIDINRSMDATVALDVETSARIGTMAEYRLQNGTDDYARVTGGYFNESIRSNANNDVVDDQIADPNVPINRWGFIGQLREHITPNLVAFADTIYTSDSLYLRDMDIYTLSQGLRLEFRPLRTGNSDFGLQQSFENSYVRLDGTVDPGLYPGATIRASDYARTALERPPESSALGRPTWTMISRASISCAKARSMVCASISIRA